MISVDRNILNSVCEFFRILAPKIVFTINCWYERFFKDFLSCIVLGNFTAFFNNSKSVRSVGNFEQRSFRGRKTMLNGLATYNIIFGIGFYP